MGTDFARKLLADSFGIAFNDPRMDKILETIELARRDSQIYELRTDPHNPMAVPAIAKRFTMSRRMCHRIILNQLMLRRAG